MTIKDVCARVRALGCACRYQAEYAEWRIDYQRTDSRWSEDTAYFTTYPDDAISTARSMMDTRKSESEK